MRSTAMRCASPIQRGSHADLTPDYAAVRGEMEAVAAFFGKKVLREVDEAAFYENLPAVRKKTGDRAVRAPFIFLVSAARAKAIVRRCAGRQV